MISLRREVSLRDHYLLIQLTSTPGDELCVWNIEYGNMGIQILSLFLASWEARESQQNIMVAGTALRSSRLILWT